MKKRAKWLQWKTLPAKSWGDILQYACLSWKELNLSVDGGVILNFRYPLTPRMFLESAKNDLTDGEERGLINALSNAKRAIDCQTDSFLCAVGFSPKRLNKQFSRSVAEELQLFSPNVEQPLKFRVIESLGIVTPEIVNRIRSIRNLLEHEYKKPPAKVVKDAIDIATLFVKSCQGEMNSFLEDVYLGYGNMKHPYGGDVFKRDIHIGLNDDEHVHIKVRFRNFEKLEEANIDVSPGDPTYLALLRVLFSVRSGEGLNQTLSVAAKAGGLVVNKFKIHEDFVRYR